jgi:hypothetical protein
MYDPEAKYLTHYLIDFSSTLGADNADPQLPRFGNEYFLDFATIGRSMIAGGFYVKPWEIPIKMEFPSVGYFESEYFDPERWRPTYPNPAFLRTTVRDAYWGAKIVTSFTDEDIEGIARTGGFTDRQAERYVAEVLKARRDKIGRYYFNLINPLDRFRLVETASGEPALSFENLALTRGYAPSSHVMYRYSIHPPGEQAAIEGHAEAPRIPLGKPVVEAGERAVSSHSEADPIVSVRIQTSYDGGLQWSKALVVFIRREGPTGRLSLAGLDRMN